MRVRTRPQAFLPTFVGPPRWPRALLLRTSVETTIRRSGIFVTAPVVGRLIFAEVYFRRSNGRARTSMGANSTFGIEYRYHLAIRTMLPVDSNPRRAMARRRARFGSAALALE